MQKMSETIAISYRAEASQEEIKDLQQYSIFNIRISEQMYKYSNNHESIASK